MNAQLPGLGLIVAWAKKIRLVRVVKNRLVPIAKARPLLHDSRALWNRAFDAFVELGDEIVGPQGFGAGLFNELYDEIVPDVLRTLYGMPEAFPVIRLQESVWLTCRTAFRVEDASTTQQRLWRNLTDSDVWRVLRTLADFGAVELTTGTVAPIFLADLDEDSSVDDENDTLPPDARENLRAALGPEAGPIDLVRLTPPATARVHTWLVDEGRCAPLVGELSEATSAQVLATIAERYPPEAARTEIDHWLSTHDSHGPQQLIDAVRQCPFRSRAAAMLEVLSVVRDDGTVLLRQLRSDNTLGPLAVQGLMTSGLLDQDDLTESEQLLGLAEQLIQAVETVGPEAVRDTLLTESSPDEALNVLAAALDSGHPANSGLHELRTLVAEPLRKQTSSRSHKHPLAGLSRASTKHTRTR